MFEQIFENKYYKTIKENLPAIILIPTILGGLWQIFELSHIGLEYIRFFSIAQVIPDGLLFLTSIIVIRLLGVLIKLAGSFIKERTKDPFEKNEEINKGESEISNTPEVIRVIGSLLLIIFIISILISLGRTFPILFGKVGSFFFKVCIFTYIGIKFSNYLIKGGIIKINKERQEKQKIRIDIMQEQFKLAGKKQGGSSFIVGGVIIIFFLFIMKISSNKINLTCLEDNKKALYFNDKYIFIEDINSKQITTFQFEDQFNGNICK